MMESLQDKCLLIYLVLEFMPCWWEFIVSICVEYLGLMLLDVQ